MLRVVQVVRQQQCNGHCLCDSVQARQLKQQLRSAQVTGQWRGNTALTLPLFWRRSTVSPVFFGRYPRPVEPTLQAPFSGTFLQTLPDLVTSLNGHSLSPRSCPATRSAPSERFGCLGTDKTVELSNLAPKHARTHETHPPLVKKRVPSRFKRFWFDLSWRKQHGQL